MLVEDERTDDFVFPQKYVRCGRKRIERINEKVERDVVDNATIGETRRSVKTKESVCSAKWKNILVEEEDYKFYTSLFVAHTDVSFLCEHSRARDDESLLGLLEGKIWPDFSYFLQIF